MTHGIDHTSRTRRWKSWALLAVTAVAAFLRLYRISSIPPGDGYDPAWYGVDALQILQGELPVYLPTNIGREAMFSYVVAICVAVFGIGPHAIHIAAALIGVLTVPATYLAVDALFAAETPFLRRGAGLISALTVAVSFWHQHWSRYGVRAILVPLFATLSIWAMAHMLQASGPVRRRWALATGALLGLSFYTYQSARVLPALVVFIIAVTLTARGAWSREVWVDLLMLGLATAVVFTPMGVYFVRHPGLGNERIDQTWAVSPDRTLQENVRAVWGEVMDAIRVLAVEGDNEVIHNLPGRPAMNAFLLVLLALGALIALRRARRFCYWTLLAWVPAMSITAFLTNGGQPTKRALGALPAFAALIAVGALTPLSALLAPATQSDTGRRLRVRTKRVLAGLWILALSTGFVHSGWATYRDYFIIWGRDPNLWAHFEGGRVAIGQYAATLPLDGTIYSSPEMPDHPSIVYNSGGRTDLRGYNGRLCTVLPAVTADPTTYIIVQHEEGRSLKLLQEIYPPGTLSATGPDYFGEPYFTAYQVPAGTEARIAPQHVVSSNWNGVVRFLGYDTAQNVATPGDTLVLTLYTQSVAATDADYVLFVHMVNAAEIRNPATGSALWAQDDSAPCRGFYPTFGWQPGEVVRDDYALQIPPEAPSGRYNLQMGFYTWPDFQHLTTTDGPSDEPQIAFVFGAVEVRAP